MTIFTQAAAVFITALLLNVLWNTYVRNRKYSVLRLLSHSISQTIALGIVFYVMSILICLAGGLV